MIVDRLLQPRQRSRRSSVFALLMSQEMSRFFFHVVNGSFMPDHEGMECSTTDEVKTEAVKAAGAMIHDQGSAVWNTGHWDMFVCDERNRTYLKLSFTVEDLTGKLD